jgi:hypothetical protein
MVTESQIARWLDQRCIGYLKTGMDITHDVCEGRVQLRNGSVVDAWIVSRIGSIGSTVFTRPNIDITAEGKPVVFEEQGGTR